MSQGLNISNPTSRLGLTQNTEPSILEVKCPGPILSDELFLFIMTISLAGICQVITVVGIASNIINLVVFTRQGFSDPVNISLTALAISDLFSLITIMWTNLCFSPAFRYSGISVETTEVHLITGSLPHVVFTRITGWITAFISFERCVCVVYPLKVKTLFTPRSHAVAMAAIYVMTLGTHAIACFVVGLDWKFYPERNETLIGLVYLSIAKDYQVAVDFSHALNGVLMPVLCFFSVVLCTAFLVKQLNEKAAWRKANSSNTEGNITLRDQKVAKMVVFISVMFIACFVPAVITFIAGFVEPQLNFDGLYKNMFLVTLSVSFNTEAINSSINFLIYYAMSTKYKKTFLRLIGFKMVH